MMINHNYWVVFIILFLGSPLSADRKERTAVFLELAEQVEEIPESEFQISHPLLQTPGLAWLVKYAWVVRNRGKALLNYAITADPELLQMLRNSGKGSLVSDYIVWPDWSTQVFPIFKAITAGKIESFRNLVYPRSDESSTLAWLIEHPNENQAEMLHLLMLIDPQFPDLDVELLNTEVEGLTPVCRSIVCGNTDFLKLLLVARANPDCTPVDGISPLQVATQRGNIQAVQSLCRAGANIYAGRPGSTALDYAKQNKCQPLITFFENIMQKDLAARCDLHKPRVLPLLTLCARVFIKHRNQIVLQKCPPQTDDEQRLCLEDLSTYCAAKAPRLLPEDVNDFVALVENPEAEVMRCFEVVDLERLALLDAQGIDIHNLKGSYFWQLSPSTGPFRLVPYFNKEVFRGLFSRKVVTPIVPALLIARASENELLVNKLLELKACHSLCIEGDIHKPHYGKYWAFD